MNVGRCLRIVAIGTGFAVSAAAVANAQGQLGYSVNDFGGVGLLQTRTARFAPSGQFEVGVSSGEPYRRLFITTTALPWLEGTFRYSEITNRLYSETFAFSGNQSFKDRGADLKFSLVTEGRYVPAIALGVQDGLGTGVFSGEYLVASKRYFDIDFHLGLGWGYFAGRRSFRNPLSYLSDSFRLRDDRSQFGGTFTLSNYFSGEKVSSFGGIEYFTPVNGLSLKLELEGNDYFREPLGNRFEPRSPINVGINYRPYSWLDTGFGFERGNTAMARLVLRTNFNDPGLPKLDGPPTPIVRRTLREGEKPESAAVSGLTSPPAPVRDEPNGDLMFERLEALGYEVAAIEFDAGQSVIRIDGTGSVTPTEVALAVFSTLDLPVRGVVVGDSEASGGRSWFFDRPDLVQAKRVENLYGGLEQLGYAVEQVEVLGENLRVWARALGSTSTADELTLAKFINQVVPIAQSIELLVTREGSEAKTIVFRPNNQIAANATESIGTSVVSVSDRDAAMTIIEAFSGGEITVDAVQLSGPRATVYVTPRRFREVGRNLGRTARIVASHAPEKIEEISIVQIIAGIPVGQVTILRKDLEGAVEGNGSPEEVWATTVAGPTPAPNLDQAVENPNRYPDFKWSVAPRLREHVGGPEGFILYQLWVALGARLEVARGLSLAGTVGVDIYNNFDRLRTPCSSVLQHVRCDVQRYLKEGQNNLVNLRLDYARSLALEWYGAVYGGIFEAMFGGIGAEILHRPFDSRFAVGLDINRAKQRTFEQRFSFQEYEITTGHVNFYYQWPIYDIQTSLHVGRYLAGDVGGTLFVSREFESGARVGVWATQTNVSAAEFGEGSFDKGFFISIPFQLLTLESTRAVNTFAFRPLTRDGGQMLGATKRLYGDTADGSLGRLAKDWDRLLD
ncbi:MAG: YjbH domain-containing protein [Alphaproteobacteria bacterium]|nr:YjbH domain-containing protein [Alphaproteobacteria bacterium]